MKRISSFDGYYIKLNDNSWPIVIMCKIKGTYSNGLR